MDYSHFLWCCYWYTTFCNLMLDKSVYPLNAKPPFTKKMRYEQTYQMPDSSDLFFRF